MSCNLRRVHYYKVILIHPISKCNLNCSFCYNKQINDSNKKMSYDDWFLLVDDFSKLTKQVAIGGGEPLLEPIFIREFSRSLFNKNVICNITTNGKLIQTVPTKTFDYLTLVSISFDKEKINSLFDIEQVAENIDYLRITQKKNKNRKKDLLIGCNLLLDDYIAEHLVKFVSTLLNGFSTKKANKPKFDFVFLLYPKGIQAPDILKYKTNFYAVDILFPNKVFVDDCTSQILKEGTKNKWKTNCHYGIDSISINNLGEVYGCSFEKKEKIGYVDKKERRVIVDSHIRKRYSCPFIL